MSHETKVFFIRLTFLLLITPIMGFGLLRYLEYFERIWKTNNKKKVVNNLHAFFYASLSRRVYSALVLIRIR